MNPPRVYTCSPSWTPFPTPFPSHPSGWFSAPAPGILYHALKLDWLFVSHMIIYMFQCHSPKSSHPCPLPQSPKDCSIHLCLFCCLAYRVIVIFKETPYCSPKWLYLFTFSPTVQECSLFSTPSPAFILCRSFNDGHFDRCEVILHCSFDLHFSNNEWWRASFHVLVGHLYLFFREMSV